MNALKARLLARRSGYEAQLIVATRNEDAWRIDIAQRGIERIDALLLELCPG